MLALCVQAGHCSRVVVSGPPHKQMSNSSGSKVTFYRSQAGRAGAVVICEVSHLWQSQLVSRHDAVMQGHRALVCCQCYLARILADLA